MIWRDQTPIVDWNPQTTTTNINKSMYQRDDIQLIGIIGRFADRTSDGGVLLISNSSSFIGWIVSLQEGHISKILPHLTLSEATITKWTGLLLPSMGSAFYSPYLEAIQWIETATGLSQERIGELLHVTRQTINRWEKGEPIRDHNRKHLFAVRDVLERAALRHPTPSMLAAWLDTPQGSDGRTPAELLRDNEINRARLLAISSPSPRLKRAPSWVNRPIPEAFRAGAEHRQEVLSPDTDQEAGLVLLEEEDGTDEGGEDLLIT